MITVVGLLLTACDTSAQTTLNKDLRLLGENGVQPGQFSKPRAVSFTSDNQIVVIDRSGRIQSFSTETDVQNETWMLQGFVNGTPTGMSLDPLDGSLWVADTHYQRIINYATDGTILNQWGENGTDPGQMIYPTDVCPDPDGKTVWVSEFGLRSRVMHFTREGEFISEWGSGEYEYTDLQRPMAIVIDSQNRIFIADAGNHRILVYNHKGERLDVWGIPGTEPGELKFPYDLALGSDESLYVCENGNSRVTRFSSTGEFTGTWGFAGFAPEGLNTPWGISFDDQGTMAIADSYNGRIQILKNAAQHFTMPEGRTSAAVPEVSEGEAG